MREIKYRQPIFNRKGTFFYFHYWGWISEGNFVSPVSMAHECKNERGQQYTGLKDKNGKEIYEGDIAKITYSRIHGLEAGMPEEFHYTEIGVMDFNQKDAQFSFLVKDSLFDHNFNELKVEVIGNIYENPDLLDRKATR